MGDDIMRFPRDRVRSSRTARRARSSSVRSVWAASARSAHHLELMLSTAIVPAVDKWSHYRAIQVRQVPY